MTPKPTKSEHAAFADGRVYFHTETATRRAEMLTTDSGFRVRRFERRREDWHPHEDEHYRDRRRALERVLAWTEGE